MKIQGNKKDCGICVIFEAANSQEENKLKELLDAISLSGVKLIGLDAVEFVFPPVVYKINATH